MTRTNAFAVGDVVSCIDRSDGPPHRCTVIKVMPVEHTVRTYRVRDETEAFERSVDESALTLLTPATGRSKAGR